MIPESTPKASYVVTPMHVADFSVNLATHLGDFLDQYGYSCIILCNNYRVCNTLFLGHFWIFLLK